MLYLRTKYPSPKRQQNSHESKIVQPNANNFNYQLLNFDQIVCARKLHK